MRKVLVLNNDYSALSIVSAYNAFLLIYLEKAEQLARVDGEYLRTISKQFPMPSVIRLKRYVNIPFRKVMMSRQNIYRRDGYICQYCGHNKDLTLDHVMPKSRGGKSSWTNLVTCCSSCNSIKGDKTPEEANMPLFKEPLRPTFLRFIRKYNASSNEWDFYLNNQSA